MVRQPLIVDDTTPDDVDDDELELVEGAAAVGGQTNAAAAGSGGAQGDPPEKKKSVRLAADGELYRVPLTCCLCVRACACMHVQTDGGGAAWHVLPARRMQNS